MCIQQIFREENRFDTISQIKDRHSKHCWMAKGLVESVDCWGVNNAIGDTNSGPFYCGLSQILNIGHIDVHLKAPLSTSKDIEVAINFATSDGVILTLNNNTPIGIQDKMIDCSWVSRYAEENERR